jgi:hypothetical protein
MMQFGFLLEVEFLQKIIKDINKGDKCLFFFFFDNHLTFWQQFIVHYRLK